MTDESGILERVIAIREEQGLNVRRFALSLHIDPGTYSKAEKGQRALSKGMLLAIASTYHINPHWLMTGKGEKEAAPLHEASTLQVVQEPRLPYAAHDSDEDKLQKLALDLLRVMHQSASSILVKGKEVPVSQAPEEEVVARAYRLARAFLAESGKWRSGDRTKTLR